MKNLSVANAIGILAPLEAHAKAHNIIPVGDRQSVIDAMDHHDQGVFAMAFKVVGLLRDHTPFETAINKHACNHADITRAKEAYQVLLNTKDLAPYSKALEMGCKSLEHKISDAALCALFIEASNRKALPSACHPALIAGLEHTAYQNVKFAYVTLGQLQDKSPFLQTLQNAVKNIHWADIKVRAEECLKEIAISGAAAQSSTNSSPIKDVRLNFNIAKNGSDIGPDVHLHDSVKALSALFDKSASVWAEVFYDPNGKLAEGSMIEVELPKNYKDAVLTDTLAGRAPAMTVRQRANGKYFATLTT